MSLSMSRFIGASSISTLPSSNSRYLASILISFPYNTDLASRKVHDFTSTSLQYDPIKRISRRSFVVRSNITPPPPGAPLPSGSPSGSMRNWIVGIVLTFVLPFFTHKLGPLQVLKNKVDTAVNSVEHIVEAIADVAEKVDDMIDNITDDLPENSKLRKTMESIDELVEGVAKAAHATDDIIDKLEEVEDKLEAMILDEAKHVDDADASKQVVKEEEIRTQERKSK
uniref:uncharacterized protein LOC122590044 n=1 Tax=Erigeron canadensis TaxID=72917 RepID=UPI001CB8C7A1|nr:uncharacterized protein LOC122590044 [Erigeron canadensis]